MDAELPRWIAKLISWVMLCSFWLYSDSRLLEFFILEATSLTRSWHCHPRVSTPKAIPLRFSSKCSSCHTLFVKEHSVRHHEDDKPLGRTLFVLNVPPYATENSLKEVFASAGNVTNVIFQPSTSNDNSESTNGFKTAYVVFAKRESLLKSLKLTDLSTADVPFKTGMDKWVSDYNNSICDFKELRKEIEDFMQKYDKEEVKKKKDKGVDDEGWTIVSKKGRKPGTSRKESVELKINEKNKVQLKKKELKNFYTFQIREGKMKNLAVLRKNYEEAKKKVNLMKNARRFKPY